MLEQSIYYLLDRFIDLIYLGTVTCLHYYKWTYFHLVEFLLQGFDSLQANLSVLDD